MLKIRGARIAASEGLLPHHLAVESPPEWSRPVWLRYGVAALASAIAVLTTFQFRQILQGSPFLFPLLAVFFAGWFGGVGPSLVATVATAVGIQLVVLPAAAVPRPFASHDRLRLVLYLAVAGCASLLQHRVSKKQRQTTLFSGIVEQILANLGDAFCRVDGDDVCVYANREAERLLGSPRAALLGKNIRELLGRDEGLTRALRDARERDQRTELEIRAAGDDRWFEVVVAPSSDGASVQLRDSTERKRSEATLQRMAAIVESSEDAIIAKSLEGTIIAWNAGAERLFGYSASEIIGQPISRLMPEERRDDMNEILGKIRRGERVQTFETVRVSKAGRRIPVSLSVSPVKDRTGKIIAAAKIARDISERLRIEAAIVEGQRQLTMALNAARMGTWSWDIATGHLTWSESLLAIHGFAPGTFRGTYEAFLECIHPEDRSGVGDSVRRAVEEGSTYDTEFRVFFPDGSIHWVGGHGQVFVDGKGAPTRMIGIGRDITDQKAAEAERERLYQEARQAVHRRDEFLSVAGHEFRTPLGALRLMLHNLRDRANRRNDAETAGGLGRVERQVDRLVRLTEHLLEVGKIEAGRLQLEREEMDLTFVCRDVVERLEETARRAGSALRLDVSEPCVRGFWDQSRLDQVITNLLTNAIKFGRGQPIDVTLRCSADTARLTVRDHGIGISREDQSRIFERFERAVSEKSYSGMGLGLWICREIVEAHGGRIEVESEPGSGSTFEVELPATLAIQPEAHADSRRG